MIRLITELASGDRYELDINQDAPISLNKTFQELTDITKRKGDFSRAFSLPKTTANDFFFGSFGDPSTFGTNWNPSLVAPAWLLEDSNIIIEGSLRLESTDPKLNRYNVSIYGRNFSLKDTFAEDLMSDLNMSSWSFNPSQVLQLTQGSLFGGDMVMPIHDVGFAIGLYKEIGGTLTFVDPDSTGSDNTIIADRNIPCFRLNELLRKMFTEKGFVLSGSWFSEPVVEDIYVQADNPRESFLKGAEKFTASLNSTQLTPLSTSPQLVPFKLDAGFDGDDWDDATSKFTAPFAGTFNFQFRFFITQGTPNNVPFLVDYYINGSLFATYQHLYWNTSPLNLFPVGFTLAAGDTLQIYVRVGSFTTPGSLLANPNTIFRLDSFTPSGPVVDPSVYWENHTQIDFLREILGIFNLILWFEDEQSVVIDTYDYYMATYGSKKDWTSKVDISSNPVVRPINEELRNPIFLSLKESEDILNDEYVSIVGRPYGSYLEDTNLPHTKDKAKPFEKFAPMPQNRYISSKPGTQKHDDWFFMRFYESEENTAYKQPGLILCYYNGSRTLNNAIYVREYEGGPAQFKSTYPFFSPFKLSSPYVISTGTFDLNFTWFTPPDNAFVSAPTDNNLYNRYFKEMLRERYDPAVKIVEFKAILTPQDIQQFNFADTIIITINGTPVGLKIIEIRDYSPNRAIPARIKAYITFVE